MNMNQDNNRKFIKTDTFTENVSQHKEGNQNQILSSLKNEADFAKKYINQVVGICMNENLLKVKNSNLISEAKQKAEGYLRSLKFGAYTCSKGVESVRKNIANFITRRDGYQHKADEDKIFLTFGALDAYQHIIGSFCPKYKMLVPSMCYPMYKQYNEASGIESISYNLRTDYCSNSINEAQIDTTEIRRMLTNNISVNPKVMLVINPNNPTGALLSRLEMEDIVKLCVDFNMVLIASEVLQETVCFRNTAPIHGSQNLKKKFISFREVINSMDEPYNQLELFSIYTASKSLLNFPSYRTGYFELLNIDSDVCKELYKHVSIDIATNTVSQIVLDILVSSPTPTAEERLDINKLGFEEIFSTRYNQSLIAAKTLQKLKKEEIFKILSTQHQLMSVYYPDAGNNFLIELNHNKLVNIADKSECDSHKNLKLCEIYSTKLFEETGIETIPGTAYGNYPCHIVLNMNSNIFDMERIKAFTNFNNKLMDISNNNAKYGRTLVDNGETRLRV